MRYKGTYTCAKNQNIQAWELTRLFDEVNKRTLRTASFRELPAASLRNLAPSRRRWLVRSSAVAGRRARRAGRRLDSPLQPCSGTRDPRCCCGLCESPSPREMPASTDLARLKSEKYPKNCVPILRSVVDLQNSVLTETATDSGSQGVSNFTLNVGNVA